MRQIMHQHDCLQISYKKQDNGVFDDRPKYFFPMTSDTAFAPSPSTSVQRSTASSKNRHYYNSDDVAYILPGDNEGMLHMIAYCSSHGKWLTSHAEDDRLDRQHWGIKILCGNSFGSPVGDALEQGITVLDSGCGPGTFMRELGKEYPKSKFHGVDIATHPRKAIELLNCEFHVHNILHDPIFPDNYFGFIHQRFLVFGLPSSDWEKVYIYTLNYYNALTPEFFTNVCIKGCVDTNAIAETRWLDRIDRGKRHASLCVDHDAHSFSLIVNGVTM